MPEVCWQNILIHSKNSAQAEKTRRTRENTFKCVATNWYELKKAAGLKPHTLQDIWNSLNRYVFPHIGEIGIDELTAQQVIAALEPCRAGGKLETVKRMTQRINEVMDYAMNAGLIVANPVARVGRAFPRPVVRHRPSLPRAVTGTDARTVCRQYPVTDALSDRMAAHHVPPCRGIRCPLERSGYEGTRVAYSGRSHEDAAAAHHSAQRTGHETA